MQRFYASEFSALTYDPASGVLEQSWTEATEEMDDEGFQREMWQYLYAVKEFGARRILVDLHKMRYTVPPVMQEWVDRYIASEAKAYVQAIALVMPPDYIARLSIEQSLEEENHLGAASGYFSTCEAALKWLPSA